MTLLTRRFGLAVCLLAALALMSSGAVGCSTFGGLNPLVSLQFAQNSTISGVGGPIQPPPDDDDDDDDTSDQVLSSVCNLPVARRGVNVSIANQAVDEQVQFSMSFLVSAGPGGFVCEDEIQSYLNAGYVDRLVPGQGNTVTVGCDTVTLLSGNRLLALEFGVNQGALATIPRNDGGDPANNLPTLELRRRDNNSRLIPLPEIIVLGNESVNFTCVGGAQFGDLCTQRGFVYVNLNGLPVGKSAEASRIQGTVCNEGFGTAPEWRLDKTLLDGVVQPFQYVAGGSIVVTVLDRADDAVGNPRVQVVWLVTDENGATVHFPEN